MSPKAHNGRVSEPISEQKELFPRPPELVESEREFRASVDIPMTEKMVHSGARFLLWRLMWQLVLIQVFKGGFLQRAGMDVLTDLERKKLLRKCKANGGGIRENLPDIIPKEVIGQAASFALLNILVWLVPLRLQVFDYIAKDGSLGYIIRRIHHLNPASNDMKDPARSERKVGGLTSTRQWIRVALALRDTAMPLALC